MELAVVNTSGAEVKKVAAEESVFSAEVKQSVVHAVVRWQRAKRRSGTHATLNLARMAGGTRKPFKQKGLGRARAGSVNSPLWVGGAVIFGPQPRDYSHKLPRKVLKQARLGVLSERAANGAITIVDDFSMEAPKTKVFKDLLSKLKLDTPVTRIRTDRGNEGEEVDGTRKVLFLFSEGEEAAVLSARNLSNVSCLDVAGLNVYDLINHDNLLMSEKTFSLLQERCLGKQKEA
jgi:large subunit ribosomal protein L4